MSDAMKADDREPDYRAAMLYHSDRADALMAERDALATEITRLRAQVEAADKLAEAAKQLANRAEFTRKGGGIGSWREIRETFAALSAYGDDGGQRARAALAVASGDLIPKADAEQAVALAYQRAADLFNSENFPPQTEEGEKDYCPHGRYKPQYHCRECETTAILALAPAEPLAEVQALIKERDQFAATVVNLAQQRDAAEAVARFTRALSKQANGGLPRQKCSYVGHRLDEGSWHVHLAGFCSKEDAVAALSVLLSVPAPQKDATP